MKKGLAATILLTGLLALPVMAEEQRVDIDISGRPQIGPADAPVTIVEFLDFQ